MSPAVLASQYLWSIPPHRLRGFELPPEGKENAVRMSPCGTSAVTTVALAAGIEAQPFQTCFRSHPPFSYGAQLQALIFAACSALPGCQDPTDTRVSHCSL